MGSTGFMYATPDQPIPVFNSWTEFCIYLQESLRAELAEIAVTMKHGEARGEIDDRVAELDRQLTALRGKRG